MTNTARTAAEHHIETIMRQLDPDSPRYRVLLSARDFKSSWVSLGEQLQRVLQQKLFSDWGYATFEEYCRQEIRIRTQTAMKLTRAYHFLEREEPRLVAERDSLRPLPDFRAVDLLRQAREEQDADEEDYRQLRQAVLDEGKSLATVRRQFRALADATQDDDERRQQKLKTTLAAARRLATLLEELPETRPEHRDALRQLTAELAGRLDERD
ncbi:hypothetical protein EDC39_10522 [Geothermobacter ehrlichii]|uniref:Uncharacterized protein n=1 Tax=Geothermobacter ehrlichii TaxID=213224 RepID=A0A5D3WIB5_9BACT|nr:hypothetical protein [Geothermobacter ehrlichii]TYO98662.1 hypothetical protein EDC39_10522 [Geothermobacter ehrlichii]